MGPWLELRGEAMAARSRVSAREADVGRLTEEIAALDADYKAADSTIEASVTAEASARAAAVSAEETPLQPSPVSSNRSPAFCLTWTQR